MIVFAMFMFALIVFVFTGVGTIVQFAALWLGATPEQAVGASVWFIIGLVAFLVVMYIISIPQMQAEAIEAEAWDRTQERMMWNCNHYGEQRSYRAGTLKGD